MIRLWYPDIRVVGWRNGNDDLPRANVESGAAAKESSLEKGGRGEGSVPREKIETEGRCLTVLSV